ncbi:MAG: hypothetical protein ACP5SH_25110 [Syntrophobacteraceae bacterium]
MSDNADRLDKVAVVRENSRNFEIALEGIEEQMRGEIYVTSLFFDLDDLDDVRLRLRQGNTRPEIGGFYQTGKLLGQQECTHVHRNFRHRTQRIKLNLLPRWRRLIDPA